MSRRFGRNQKRRMRAEIAALEQERARQADAADKAAKKAAKSEACRDIAVAALESFRQELGSLCSLLPATRQRIPDPLEVYRSARGYLLRIEDRRPVELSSSHDDALSPIELQGWISELQLAVARVDRDALRDHLHVVLEFVDRRVAYGITARAMAMKGARAVAGEIIKALGLEIEQALLREGLRQ